MNQLSGSVAVSSSEPGTTALRVPDNAQGPGLITILNADTAAVIYFRWCRLDQTPQLNSGIAAGRIQPGAGYTWENNFPAGCQLQLLSTVDKSQVMIDANWSYAEKGAYA